MAQNQVIYKDYSIDADLTSTGALKVLEGRDAITNALKLWISSFRGEVMRDPSKGGYNLNCYDLEWDWNFH